MKEYLLGVVGTVSLCAVLCSILPNGKTSGLVILISRWVCVLAILTPVIEYFNGGETSFFDEKSEEVFFSESVIEQEEAFINYYSELRIRETERQLENEVRQRYAVEMEFTLSYETPEANLGKIKINKIYGKAKEKMKEEEYKVVWEYLTKNYCNEVLLE